MGAAKFKKCPQCGAIFVCYSDTTTRCWCMDIVLSAEQLEYIANNYAGCLCSQCLTTMASASEIGEGNKFAYHTK